jgi:hypothetical protein
MSRILSLRPWMRCDSPWTSAASCTSSPLALSAVCRPSSDAFSDAMARPITVSAVSAAWVAVCESWVMVAVVSRTEAAVSAVVLVKAETFPSSPWAAWNSSWAVFSKLSRFSASSEPIASVWRAIE